MKFTRRGGRLALFLVTLFVFAGAATLGCSKKEAAESEESGKDFGVKDAIEHFTGKAQIEQGERLRNQIRDIEAERKRQSDEAMGE